MEGGEEGGTTVGVDGAGARAARVLKGLIHACRLVQALRMLRGPAELLLRGVLWRPVKVGGNGNGVIRCSSSSSEGGERGRRVP